MSRWDWNRYELGTESWGPFFVWAGIIALILVLKAIF